MKLRQLAMRLSAQRGFSHPRVSLEQYQTPGDLAARLLTDAQLNGDITGHVVCDLGCGTGVLAVGAALLGARDVIGLDTDREAVDTAVANAHNEGVQVRFITGDVRDPSLAEVIGPVETVVMNPPFGAQIPHADRPFLDLALRISPVIYSIFNEGSLPFVSQYIAGRARITGIVQGRFALKRVFFFHRREVQEISVEILRIVRI